jgi:prepilin-type processing-associated H-X9-DG protein
MYCTKCGQENPDNVQVCQACGAALISSSAQAPGIGVKSSGMAIAAFVLGILSIFTCALTAIPAIILGIVSLVRIEKSGGSLTGRGFAIAGIVVPAVTLPLIALLMGIMMPALARTRQLAFRMVCGTNLAGIGKAMQIYANDYDGAYPRSGGKNSRWASHIPDWRANNRFGAYDVFATGEGGTANITSCFYLLVKYCEVTPKSFICKGDAGATEFNPFDENAGNIELIDLWDFGPEPSKHCSYSYHMPFGLYALTTESDPGMAVATDRNPWQSSPAATAPAFPNRYNPDGGKEAIKAGNAIVHQKDGQNVLFMDGHVAFEKRPFCGINDDNIYTFWDSGDIRIGSTPLIGSEPKNRVDSLLVNNGP